MRLEYFNEMALVPGTLTKGDWIAIRRLLIVDMIVIKTSSKYLATVPSPSITCIQAGVGCRLTGRHIWKSFTGKTDKNLDRLLFKPCRLGSPKS